MVAERLLDLRLPDLPSPAAPMDQAMASPALAEVFGPYLDPPMRTYGDHTMNDYIRAGTAGALVIQAVVIAGGRVVQGIYNHITKKPQIIYTEEGKMIDFPTTTPLAILDGERPTTPRPTTTRPTATATTADDNNVGAAASAKILDIAANSLSFASQSPHTPIAALFPDTKTDEQTARDLEKTAKGKWDQGNNATAIIKTKEEVMEENKALKEELLLYKSKQGKPSGGMIYDQCPWTPALVTRMSPNASPDKNMQHIVDNLSGWAEKALQIGQFPGPQLVDGRVVDVTNIVKVEMEKIKKKSEGGTTNNGNGAQGSRGTAGFGMPSPSTDGSHESPGNWIANLAASGGDDGDGGDDNGPDNYEIAQLDNRGGGHTDRSKEFTLVNPLNISIPTFTGKTLNSNPYLPFNNAIRRLVMAQGADGDTVLTILDKVEKMGTNTFTNQMLKELTGIYSKAPEYDRAIRAALLNWTSGIAKGLVQHNVANGLDAWRKLYNRYIPLASDLQDILIRELYDLKPVSEAEVDSLFDEIARIRDLYLKAGPGEDLSDKWIKSAILRNLPKDLVKNLAFELRKASTVEDIQSIITIYLHDPVTGLARGQTGPLICMTAQDRPEEEPDKTESKTYSQAANLAGAHASQQAQPKPEPSQDADINAVKGDKRKSDGKGKGKGYGECWHCGEWGHPRRECPVLLKEKGTLAALKGKGKGKGKGWKGGKGYKGGKGKGYGGGKGGRGKGTYIGKGLNYYGEEDYYNAWGGDDYNYEYEDWGWGGDNYYMVASTPCRRHPFRRCCLSPLSSALPLHAPT